MYEKFYNQYNLSISEYVRLLFSATKDGILNIPYFKQGDSSVRTPVHIETLKMIWEENDVEGAIEYSEMLVSNIRKIVRMKKDADDSEEFYINLDADPALKAFFNKFLASLDNSVEVSMKLVELCVHSLTDKLTSEQWEFFDGIIEENIKNAQKRIGGDFYSYDVVETAQQLHSLLLSDAEEAVIKKAETDFVKAVILNMYSV